MVAVFSDIFTGGNMKKRSNYRGMEGQNPVKKLWMYIKSHIWFSLTGSMLLLFLVVVLIFQSYLKNRYFNYLMDETYGTEDAMIHASVNSLNKELENALFIGSEIAVNKQLRYDVDQVQHTSEEELVKNRLRLLNELSGINYYSSEVAAITVVMNDGTITEYGRYWTGSGYPNLWSGDSLAILDQLYSAVMENLKVREAGRYQVSEAPAFHENVHNMQMFHIALPLTGSSSALENVTAVVVVSFKLNNFMISSALQESALQDSAYRDNIAIYLTTKDGNIMYHQNPEYIGMSEEEYLADKTYVEIKQPLDYFGWVEHVVIDTENMHNEVDKLYRQGIVIYILLLFVSCIIWNLIVHTILRPVNEIGEAMSEVKAGKENRMIDIRGTNEIWQLAEQYNEMVDALYEQKKETKRHYEEKTKSIELQSKAEQKALESQINAHFLCNTLNAINYNVMESGNHEVSSLLKDLSSILQYTFSRKAREVTLGQEIEWVKQYLRLQKYRKGDQFDYKIEFPEEYSEWPCCKLFLQPFVENSIVHGFENMESGGMIKITGWEEKGRFLICVWDNGCGMPKEVCEEIKAAFEKSHELDLETQGAGIGIKNVITRMKLFFGPKFDVELESEEGVGTCFIFRLPLPRESKREEG